MTMLHTAIFRKKAMELPPTPNPKKKKAAKPKAVKKAAKKKA